MPRKLTQKQVIKKLSEALDIHAEWSSYLRGEPTKAQEVQYRPIEDIVGDYNWHDKWVAVYQRTIELLESK